MKLNDVKKFKYPKKSKTLILFNSNGKNYTQMEFKNIYFIYLIKIKLKSLKILSLK